MEELKPSHSPSMVVQPATSSDGELVPLFSWEASEYVQHQHNIGWYLILAAAASVLVLVLVFVLKEWLSAFVVILMVTALLVYARRTPSTLKYSLNDAGLSVGPRFYAYSEFKSFSLIAEEAFLTIELDSLKRFMPRLSIFLDQKNVDQVASLLESHLPRADRKPDVIDRISRKLKF